MKTVIIIAPTLVPRWNDLITALRSRGVIVISSDRESPDTDRYVPQWFGKLTARMRRPALYCPEPLALYRMLKREKVKRIIVWADGSHVSALIVRLIAGQLGVIYEIRAAQNIPDAVPAPFRWYAPHVVRGSARIYSVAPPSTAVVAPFVKDLSRIEEIGNGYDSAIFSPPEMDAPARNLDVVYAGHLELRKGVDMVAQTMRALFNEGLIARAAVIGTGPQEGALAKVLAREIAESRLELHPWHSREDLAALFRRSRILVMPSRSNITDDLGAGKMLAIPWTEQFGRVCIEAQACGVVPVVSDAGGLCFAVGEGGVVVPDITAERLTDAIRALLANSEWLSDLQTRAMANAARFTLESLAATMMRPMS